MASKLLTVVIPSYNTAEFMDKNIPTFLDGRIMDRIEILIVDDGSTDGTGGKAERYARRYPGTVRAVHKANGGHGSVINTGIEMASGTYYKVVDGDDWVDTRNFFRLVRDLEGQDADLVINPHNVVDSKTRRVRTYIPISDYGEDMPFDEACRGCRYLMMHNMTVKTDLLRRHGIRVREHCYYEDFEYVLYPIPFISTATVLDYPVYQYLTGQSGQSVSDATRIKNHEMYYTVIRDCMDYCDKWRGRIGKDRRIFMRNFLMRLLRSQYNIYLKSGFRKGSYEMMREFDRDLKSRYPTYYREIARWSRYVRLLQTESKSVFYIFSLGMYAYKLAGRAALRLTGT